MDVPLCDEVTTVVEDTATVQRSALEEKSDAFLFLPKSPYNAEIVNAQLIRHKTLTLKFGSSLWYKFTVTNSMI